MKKRIVIFLLAALMLFATACGQEVPETTTVPTTQAPTVDTTPIEPEEVTWMTLPADRTLTAKQYFVYSCETGKFLTISEDSGAKIYPASVTKLFTAYIALQYLKPSDSVTAGDEVRKVDRESSIAQIWLGDTVTVDRLVEGMLLPSGNDAAYIIAAAAGRQMLGDKNGSMGTDAAINRFVEEMNAQAKLMGMTGTHFANPDGIHSDNHYTTYADLSILATLALEDPVIRRYAVVSKEEVTTQSGVKKWKNTNLIIDPESEYYCPWAIGLKTGRTSAAGNCLLSAFEYKGQTLIIGVFGCPGMDDRFPDTLQLFNETIGVSTK